MVSDDGLAGGGDGWKGRGCVVPLPDVYDSSVDRWYGSRIDCLLIVEGGWLVVVVAWIFSFQGRVVAAGARGFITLHDVTTGT